MQKGREGRQLAQAVGKASLTTYSEERWEGREGGKHQCKGPSRRCLVHSEHSEAVVWPSTMQNKGRGAGQAQVYRALLIARTAQAPSQREGSHPGAMG